MKIPPMEMMVLLCKPFEEKLDWLATRLAREQANDYHIKGRTAKSIILEHADLVERILFEKPPHIARNMVEYWIGVKVRTAPVKSINSNKFRRRVLKDIGSRWRSQVYRTENGDGIVEGTRSKTHGNSGR